MHHGARKHSGVYFVGAAALHLFSFRGLLNACRLAGSEVCSLISKAASGEMSISYAQPSSPPRGDELSANHATACVFLRHPSCFTIDLPTLATHGRNSNDSVRVEICVGSSHQQTGFMHRLHYMCQLSDQKAWFQHSTAVHGPHHACNDVGNVADCSSWQLRLCHAHLTCACTCIQTCRAAKYVIPVRST